MEIHSQTGKYALRILGYLADRPGTWVQGREIARATGIPANYLSKILNQLRKRGLVESQKGWGGGFLLKESALPVPIAEVIELFDGKQDGNGCAFEIGECDLTRPCPLHHHWERVRGEYQEMLNTVTIVDLRSK